MFNLQPDEVYFDFRVAVLGGPQVQRSGGNFVDEWLSMAHQRQVHALEIVFAGVARLDSDVLVCRGLEVGEFGGLLFSAMRADRAAKGPNRETLRAHQVAVTALGAWLFVLQNA